MYILTHLVDIRRLTIHDGPGTRDTVFLKGCPLRCLWCHNPESISLQPQLLYRRQLCVQCGSCFGVCPKNIHQIIHGEHIVERSQCSSCGRCAASCLTGALELCGKPITPEEVFREVLKEKEFYLHSGGGVTVSGGEPLLHSEFVAELFRLLRASGIHTALDTCGHVPFTAFTAVLPYTSLMLYDMKGMNPENHRRNTGQDNTLILENLTRLGMGTVPIEIRMPIVPGYNDFPEEIQAAGNFMARLPAVHCVRLLPYHAMAHEKYRMCGLEDTLPEVLPPDTEALAACAASLRQCSGKTVIW